MSPQIVSWSGDEVKISPVVSSAGTPPIIPIESLITDASTNSPIIPEAWRARTIVPGARSANVLGVGPGTGDSETIDGSCQKCNDSFQRHSKYFFRDGNITFLVNGFLYCVHRFFFCRDSVYFSTRFDQLGVRDHEASSIIVLLGDVECKDFEAFLSVLYPSDFEEYGLSYEQWSSVLYLSTRWDFASIRKLALKTIKPPTPYERLLLARTYAVDDWIVPALTGLCERTASLNKEEIRGMESRDIELVVAVREDTIRSGGIQFDSEVSAVETSHRVERMLEAQAGVLIRVAGEDASSASPIRVVSEQGLGSKVDATTNFDVEICNGTKPAVLESVMGETPSDWNLAGATTKSQREKTEADEEQAEQHWQATLENLLANSKKKKRRGNRLAVPGPAPLREVGEEEVKL